MAELPRSSPLPADRSPDGDHRLRAVLGHLATVFAGLTAFVLTAALVAGLGGGFKKTLASPGGTSQAPPAPSQSSSPGTEQPACAADTLVGRLLKNGVPARTGPRTDARVIETFDRTTPLGSPQVFLVQGQAFGDDGLWYRVQLPVRPNGTSGFIPADKLSLTKTSYRLALSRKHFRLQLFKGCDLLRTYRVGIGTGHTPTPVGDFYLVSLLKLPQPNTIYGPYAYGLSGYSDILKTWRMGGIVGLHGTNDPSSIGRRSSHGCIRMRNRDVADLVKILPLGTPIEIN